MKLLCMLSSPQRCITRKDGGFAKFMMCIKCNIYLCFLPEKNCFEDFHLKWLFLIGQSLLIRSHYWLVIFFLLCLLKKAKYFHLKGFFFSELSPYITSCYSIKLTNLEPFLTCNNFVAFFKEIRTSKFWISFLLLLKIGAINDM